MTRASTESRAEAARLYRSGKRPEDIIRDLGLDVHPSTVVRWAGGAERPGPRGRTDLDDREIARLRDEEELSWEEIGRRVGASRIAVTRHYALAKSAAWEELSPLMRLYLSPPPDRSAEAEAAGAAVREAHRAGGHVAEGERVTCPRCGKDGLIYMRMPDNCTVALVHADYEVDQRHIIGPPGRWFAVEATRVHECTGEWTGQ